jgi:hypothetical protein
VWEGFNQQEVGSVGKNAPLVYQFLHLVFVNTCLPTTLCEQQTNKQQHHHLQPPHIASNLRNWHHFMVGLRS